MSCRSGREAVSSAGPCGRGADEGERREIERERPRRRPLPDDDVQAAVLERRIEDLLHSRREAVISSTNSTSRSSSAVRMAARSPLRSSAGPATERNPTPSSARMTCARLVLPRPGGPASRTCSSASRGRARLRVRSRAARGRAPGRRTRRASADEASARAPRRLRARAPARRAARSCSLPQCQADTLLGRQRRIDVGEHRLGVDDRVAQLDEGIAGHDVAVPFGGGLCLCRERSLQLEHDALRSLAPDAGNGLEARCPPARSLGGAPPVSSRRRWPARPSGLPRPTAAARRALAPRRRRTRTAGARPHARAGRSRPSPPSSRCPAQPRAASPGRDSRPRPRRGRGRPFPAAPACRGAARSRCHLPEERRREYGRWRRPTSAA